MYKMTLPLMLVFNKIDMVNGSTHVEWLSDFEAFEAAVKSKPSVSGDLANSLCLTLEEFYKKLKYAEVSCRTEQGFEDVVKNFDGLISEFNQDVSDLETKKKNIQTQKNENKTKKGYLKGEKIHFVLEKPE
ncbi:GPN-loop GTPase 1 [Thelohanellus kitauei]|uniref:GPN-loop GTPase n=1 Tax=Thelohanellus kitauei TaxID=669202 RepID=A0A0C2MGD2_THEKT|nr:GPN-loop GTPase 1 [Thelohanellus kitauei]